jgi:phospholipid/cholesterol/gamma-HCH transport system substrate-binding protein
VERQPDTWEDLVERFKSAMRIPSMLLFVLGCFGILLFLWLSFGGPIPLEAKQYRFNISFREAATLANEADVRMSGVNIGKVKGKKLEKSAGRTLVEVEVEEQFAPIARDSRAILRQKTLLGETFVELTPGDRASGDLPDGATLGCNEETRTAQAEGGDVPRANERCEAAQVDDTVELDEIFRLFDEDTKEAFRIWVREGARTIAGDGKDPSQDRSQDLSDALGNLSGFSEDGERLLRTLDEQGTAVRQLIKNTGVVFGALNEREGALRDLIVNADRTFDATQSRDEALAETFAIFPTFLDESRLTFERLERFSRNTDPLVTDLKPVADDLGPTVRDLAALSPDLEGFLRDLRPLIAQSPKLEDAERFLRGARPVFAALNRWLPEFNPILSFLNYSSPQVSDFITNGASALAAFVPERESEGPLNYLRQYGVINSRSLSLNQTRPTYERGNAYGIPNHHKRKKAAGALESFDCSNTTSGGEVPNPSEDANQAPPCLLVPPTLWDGKKFPFINRGESPLVPFPQNLEGTEPPGP